MTFILVKVAHNGLPNKKNYTVRLALFSKSIFYFGLHRGDEKIASPIGQYPLQDWIEYFTIFLMATNTLSAEWSIIPYFLFWTEIDC